MATPVTAAAPKARAARAHHGGIDAPAEADEDLREAAFADVVAQAEGQGGGDLREVPGEDRRTQRLRQPLGVDEQQILRAETAARHGPPRGVEDEAGAVEDELVVAADEVAVQQRLAGAAGMRGEQAQARLALASDERGGR